jgi:hypothetical protein
MLGIGLLDLKHAKDANFINCIKDGVFMDNFGRLIPTVLEEEKLRFRFSGLEIKKGDKIKMGLTQDWELYFKKGSLFNWTTSVPLKAIFDKKLFNLYPCVYLQN